MAADRTRKETFYDRVYELVKTVPPGRVTTYGAIARALGAPRASRAAGYALGALDVGSDVPWWRVVNVGGKISPRGEGFEAAMQRELLEAEGVEFGLGSAIDLGRYGVDMAAAR